MENLDEIIKEIKENTYDNELADIYIRELLDRDKEYDWIQTLIAFNTPFDRSYEKKEKIKLV